MQTIDARKIVGAIVGLLVLLLAVRTLWVAVSEPRNLGRPLYVVMGLVMAHPPGGAPLPPEASPDWSKAFAAADLKAGQALSKKCIGCHDLTAANQNKTGPGLHDVVDRFRASRAGFAYSNAMFAKPGQWTPADLFAFLRDPQLFVPWTKMGFDGLPNPQDRINLIAYLRSNGASRN